jgi:hypothetical protein
MGGWNITIPSWGAFNSKIDQVRIFNSALSASEVSDLYAEPAASNNTLNYPAGAGCIAAYPLQTDAVDLSGNYNGTPSNVTFGQPGYLTENTEGTITSTVAANVDAGFSIVKFTAPSSGVWTYGHQLNVAPELIITKNLTQSGQDWQVFLPAILGNNKKLILNTTSSEANTGVLNNTNPTNTVITQTGYGSGTDNIAYAFHSVDGYSKIGSYTGTGATGNFQYVGFKPRFLLWKKTNGAVGWFILDGIRNTSDVWSLRLEADVSSAEAGPDSYTVTVSDTGFEMTGSFASWTGSNELNGTYIYLAIA